MFPSHCIFLLHILLIIAPTRDYVGAKVLRSSDLDFNQRIVVQPIVHYGENERELLSTRDGSGGHHAQIKVIVPIGNKHFILDLHLNERLVAAAHVLHYQQAGTTVRRTPSKEELDLCHYSGSVRGKPGSWAAVSTCHGLRGAIFDGRTMWYIEPALGAEIRSSHYLYNHKDLINDYNFASIGDVTGDAMNNSELLKGSYTSTWNAIKNSRVSRYKRQSEHRVPEPYGANDKSRYLELVLVVDHEVFQGNGANVQTVHSQMIQLANIINSLYSPLNVYVALVGVVVWNEQNEIDFDDNGDTTLTNFLKYRKRKLNTEIPNDNAQLVTGKQFIDGVVAKALLGPMCTFEFSGGVITNHSDVMGVVAASVAHAIGHNFGMKHDDESCKCPDAKCLMSATVSSVVPVHWSSCSALYLKESFERGMDYCLRNRPERLFSSPTCGNGFIEEGEECDCGAAAEAPCLACCYPSTCRLHANATCGGGACCDITTCQLKGAGEVCRAKNGACDLAEFCSGQTEFCPVDVYMMDSTPCWEGDSSAFCVRGTCRSHSSQCRLLWGETAKSAHEKCYALNKRSSRNGNCGYNKINDTFTPCAPVDVLCGMLHCRHSSERLEFGMESVSIISANFINDKGTVIPCHNAIIDLGLNDVDPGLVPDGAKCGDEHMCLKQRCVSVDTLRAATRNGKSSLCPLACSGHGICNSEGHCHCDQVYAPPLCVDPGPGGSVDSGPATDLVRRSQMITN